LCSNYEVVGDRMKEDIPSIIAISVTSFFSWLTLGILIEDVSLPTSIAIASVVGISVFLAFCIFYVSERCL